MKAAWLLCFAGLVASCGFSSNSISIVGPPPPTLTSIAVTPANLTLQVGSTRQFIATGSYSDGSQQNITASVTWSSTSATVASISNVGGSNGIATGVGAGSTTITAASGTLSASATLNVTSVTLISIGVTPAAPSIAKGTSQQFTATGVYSDNSKQNLTTVVIWHAVNPAVASITTALGSGGLATGVGTGTTEITATLDGVVGSANLTVTPAVLVSIAVTPANASIPNSTTKQLTATGTYSDNSTLNLTTQVTWAPTIGAIATVSNAAGFQGLATALNPGTVTVTATLGTVVGTTGLTVTGAALVSIAVTPATATIRLSGTQQYLATGHYADLTTQDITTLVTWNSGTPATATIISNAAVSNGLATGLATGTTLITAAFGAINSNSATLTVATFAYAVNINLNNLPNASNLSQYLIGPNGTLTPMNMPTVATGPNPYSLTTDPSHTYLYVGNVNYPGSAPGSVSQFSIGADGSLAPLNPPTVAAPDGPNGITANPTAPYVYVPNYNASNVYQYSIGPGGLLTPLSNPAVGTGPGTSGASSLAVTPAGTYAYVSNYTAPGTSLGTVSQYSIGAAGSAAPGSLTLRTTPTVPAGGLPNGVVIDPTGRFVYVVNSNDNAGSTNGNSISQYTIQPDGTLLPMTPASVTTLVPLNPGHRPWSITLDAAGHNAYVPCRTSGNVLRYTIDSTTGALTYASAVQTGANSGPTSLAIDPSGAFAYVTNRDSGIPSTIAQFSIAADGDLTPLIPPTVAAGAQPVTIITSR